MRKTYENQELVEGALGKADGAVTDADGNVVGGVWMSPRSKLYSIVESAVIKLLDEHSKLPMTRATFDLLEKEIESEGTFSIVSVECASEHSLDQARIRVTTAYLEILFP